MSDKKDSLGSYLEKPPYPPLQKREIPKLVPEKKIYKAIIGFGAGEKPERFRVVASDGSFHFFSFSHLLEGSLKDDLLTLSLTTRIFQISGRNLVKVVDALSNRKAKAICTFNEKIHAPVADKNLAFIEKIEEVEDS